MAHVRSSSGLFGGSGTTAAAASDADVVAGHLLVVYVGFSNDTATVTSLTDTLGNTYPAMVGQAGGNSKGWYSYVISAFSGPNTVTVVMSAAGGGAIAVHEASGIQATTPLDKVAFVPQVGTGTGTNGVTTGNVTPTSDGQYLFAAAHDDSFSGVAFTPGTTVAWVGRESANDAGFHVRTESFVQATAAAVAGTFTASVNADTVNLILTFAAAAAAAKPFAQTDWPAPQAKPYPIELRSFARTRNPGFLEPAPVGGMLSGPAPPPRVVPIELRTWTQNRPTFYVDAVVAVPFAQTDWPVPPPPRRVPITQRWFASFYVLDETAPFLGSAWPVPAPRPFPLALRTWIHSRPVLSDEPPPFFGTAWPVPAPRAVPLGLRTWIHSRPPGLVDDLPFRNLEWPIPRGRFYPIELRTWCQGPIGDRLAALGGGLGPLVNHRRNHLVRGVD